MKVILTKDVAKVGRRHEIKELADGFARNFIIARNLGVIADEKNLKKLKIWQQEDGDKNKTGPTGEWAIKIIAKASEKGHLFASIHPEDISQALQKQHHLEIPAEIILLPEPIKALGNHQVELKTTPPGQGRLIVQVVAE